MKEETKRRIPWDLTEFLKLEKLLDESDLWYEEVIDTTLKDPYYWHCQICYPSKANKISDVVIFRGSYGVEKGLLEMYGLVDEDKIGDTVQGHMTAEEVFEIWKRHWDKYMIKERQK